MATPALQNYLAALNAWLAYPTPATAAAAVVAYSLVPRNVSADSTSTGMPELPQALVNMANAYTTPGPRVILGRPAYGDHR